MERAQRRTRQREAILEALRRQAGHPTARQIHAAVKRHLPHLSLGTVYRNLELFVRQGWAVKLAFPGQEARFDGDCRAHAHVLCIACGRLQDVDTRHFAMRPERMRSLAGFRILAVQMDLRGLCPACRSKRREPAGGEKPGRAAGSQKSSRPAAGDGRSLAPVGRARATRSTFKRLQGPALGRHAPRVV